MTRSTEKKRLCNEAYRNREYLDIEEVSALLEACKQFTRNAERNYWMLFFMVKHGLRAGELIELTWSQVNFNRKTITVTRLKNGIKSQQPLSDSQLAFLEKLKNKRRFFNSTHIFLNPQGNPFTLDGIYKIVEQAGKFSNLDIKVHPHMLRHTCGHYLIEHEQRNIRFIQGYLGHKDIKNTIRYTEFSHSKFSRFFENFESDIRR